MEDIEPESHYALNGQSFTKHYKYSDCEPGNVGAGLTWAFLTTMMGGVICCLTYISGEVILEHTHHHKNHDDTTISTMARMGVIGGLISNLALYTTIAIYAFRCDPARNKPHYHKVESDGCELVCGKPLREVGDRSPLCSMLILLALHVSNMLISGVVGHWIYTRKYTSTISFQESMESLSVGIAVTMIPFSISSLCLVTAYGNCRLPPKASQFQEYRIPDPPPKTQLDLLKEIAENTASIRNGNQSLLRAIQRI